MDDHIITIGDANGLDGWKWTMTIDLKELAEATGRKGKKFKLVEIPLTRAKKLLQLIRRYGTEDDFRKCDEYLRPNARLYKYWGTIR